MNIAIAKVGQSIKFDRNKLKSNVGGVIDTHTLFTTLIRNSPQHNFYLIGRSDFSRLDTLTLKNLNINNNVFDCYENVTRPSFKQPYEYIQKNNIKIDSAIIINGMCGTFNIPDAITKEDGSFYSLLEVFKHGCGNIVYFLNKTMVPYISISHDSRYASLIAKDLINLPKINLSQYTGHVKKETFSNYKLDEVNNINDLKLITNDIEISYAEMEKAILIDYKKPYEEVDKTIKITYVLNAGAKWNRLKVLKDYLTEDSFVYGKWDDKVLQDERFKGIVSFDELHEILRKTKYTLLIPIEPGWTTAKYLEMIMNDVVPFFHETYDSQMNIDVPNFLRVKSPNEYFDKINVLEKDDSERLKLLKTLKEKFLTKENTSGINLVNIINEKIGLITNTEFVKLKEPIQHEQEFKNISLFDL